MVDLIGIGALAVGFTLLLTVPPAIRRHRLKEQQRREQEATQARGVWDWEEDWPWVDDHLDRRSDLAAERAMEEDTRAYEQFMDPQR